MAVASGAMAITLRPYQLDAVSDFSRKSGKMLLWADVGVGKSFIGLECARRVWKAHGRDKRVLVLCPASIVKQWHDEARRMLGELPETLTITNYEKLLSDKSLMGVCWELVVADECFPYEIMVKTDKGSLKIGDIVENNIDCSVLSLNSKLNVLEYKKIVRRIKKNNNQNLIKIKHENGELVCTPNHKIFIEEKNEFIQGEKVCSGAHLRMVQGDFYGREKRSGNASILFLQLLGVLQKFITRIQRKITRLVKDFATGSNVQVVQSNISTCTKIKPWKIILQFILFHKISKVIAKLFRSVYSRNGNKEFRENDKAISESSRTTGKTIVPDEEKKSDETSGEYRKDESINERKNVPRAWRELSNYKATTCASNCVRFAKFYGTPNKNKIRSSFIRVFATLLQSRYCFPREDACNRSGRKDTQVKNVEISRSSENGSFINSRVESVEILERGGRQRFGGSSKEGEVIYNLEIEDNHNYFADNILVSNCQMICSTTAKRTKAFRKLRSRFRLAMSATPAPNALHELWSVSDWLSPSVWHASFWRFKQRECILDYFGTIIGYHNEKRLRERIAPLIHRITKDVLTELPDLNERTICIDAPDTFANAYEEMRKTCRAELSGSRITIPNAVSLISRQRQYVDTPHIFGITDSPKQKELQKLLTDTQPTLIFVEHQETAHHLGYAFQCPYITGSTPMKQRDSTVAAFQVGEHNVLVGTYANAVGRNIQRATRVISYSQFWNPARMDQSVGRAFRMGQLNEVEHITLIVRGTIDEKIAKLIEKKRKHENKFTREEILSLL